MIKFSDIEDAFFFVSSASHGLHSAILRKDTGQILYSSEMGGIDEIGDVDLDWDICIEIPHKNDLDLGQRLVFVLGGQIFGWLISPMKISQPKI